VKLRVYVDVPEKYPMPASSRTLSERSVSSFVDGRTAARLECDFPLLVERCDGCEHWLRDRQRRRARGLAKYDEHRVFGREVERHDRFGALDPVRDRFDAAGIGVPEFRLPPGDSDVPRCSPHDYDDC
jgi:hypothetical protein